jgi:hypothetical protein
MKSVADVIDLDELRDKIDDSLSQLREQINNDEIDPEESLQLLNRLLEERDYLLDEYDEIKNLYWRGFPFSNWVDTDRIAVRLQNLSPRFVSDLQEMSSTLEISKGYLMNELISFVNEKLNGNNLKDLPKVTAKEFLQYMNLDLPSASINHRKKLKVLDKDFEEVECRFSFNHIRELDLSDISLQSFHRYVKSVNHCKHVIISNNLPKLIVYAKLNHCDEIQFVREDSSV